MEDGSSARTTGPPASGIRHPSGIYQRNFFGFHGTPMGHNDLRMSWLASSRCPDCRLLLAPYWEPEI